MILITHLTACVCLVAVSCAAIQAEAIDLPPVRTVSKPDEAVATPVRRVRPQPSIPDNYRSLPFVETAPVPVLTAGEKEQGYLLFQRPIMEPVYANTRPLAH